jgi:DMSO reductase anchor subunit
MWRRSWLSREVLLFGLFFVTLTAATALAASTWFRIVPLTGHSLMLISYVAAAIGFAGIVASAFIYLVPPRPAWNMAHTPIDFLLSSALLGSAAVPLLVSSSNGIATYLDIPIHARADNLSLFGASSAILWLLNYGTRYFRLSHSTLHEHRASASLLLADGMRGVFASSIGLIAMAAACALTAHPVLAAVCAGAGVLASRYLFFVTVVPTNMALMFVRKRAA